MAAVKRLCVCAWLPLLLLLWGPMAEGGAVEIVAHRGASYDAPENTLAAVKLGWAQGADAVEVDVHLSRDQEIVAMHDTSTKRTAGVDRLVSEQSWEELKQLDAGRWKGEQWAAEPIPRLQEILATVPKGKRLFIEIKCGPEIIPHLAEVIQQSRVVPDQLVIISFSYEVVRQAKQMFPQIPVYYLSGFKQDKETGKWSPSVEELIQRAQEAELDGLDVSYKGPVDGVFIDRVHEADLELHVWTVDDPKAARRLAAAGVDSITTNRPEWLRAQLNE